MSLSTRYSALYIYSSLGQGQNLFLTWLPFSFLNPFPPYPQELLLLEAIHIIPLGLPPKVSPSSTNQGYISLTLSHVLVVFEKKANIPSLFPKCPWIYATPLPFGALTSGFLVHAHPSFAAVPFLRAAFWDFTPQTLESCLWSFLLFPKSWYLRVCFLTFSHSEI